MSADRALAPGDTARIDALPCPWVRLDAHGTVLAANRRLALLLQETPERIVGRPFDRLLTPASCVLYQVHLQPLLRLHGETAELGLTLRTPDGAGLDVLVYSTRSGDPDGGVVDVMLAPIQRRREIEAELLRIKRAADQAPGMVFQLGRDARGVLRFRYVNDSVMDLYGVPVAAATLDARAVFDRLDGGDRERLQAALERAIDSDRPAVVAVRPRHAPDPMQAHEWQFEAVTSPDGEAVWRGYVSDITERQRSQAAERRSADAERLVQVRAEFLARASHELRTPLNAILGFSQILGARDADLDAEERRRTLEVMAHSGRHLLHLVDRLLDIASADRESSTLSLVAVPLASILDGCVRRAMVAGRTTGVSITARSPPDLQVMADPTALAQVIDNFLSNAVKYNRAGGSVAIEVQRRSPERAAIEITDTGLGMSPEQQAHLFEAFNRLGAERSTVQGVGLGLVIARQLVQALGGTLDIRSQAGAGTCVTVELAIAGDPTVVAAGRPAAARSDDPAASACGAARAERGRVLYVEDNEVNVLLMQAILASRPGVELHIATTLAQADLALQAHPVDLMLLDLNLPDGRGDEWLHRRRARAAPMPTRTVLVTATTGSPMQAGAEDAGCDDRWTKPLDVAAVLVGVDRWLRDARPGP